mmetsp:Transcript_38260/g.95083  ORF Transcript_38260/g.95083 Transcript_38260/m.95083 type:complete len:238 (-) Transcript_38260:807-1520(-)
MNRVMTKESMRLHFPRASSAPRRRPRRGTAIRRGGTTHATNMSASLRYGHPPLNTAMSTDSGNTLACHMSLTLLARVNSNSGGNVSGTLGYRGAPVPPAPALAPATSCSSAESMTAAPTAVFDETKSTMLPTSARGRAHFTHWGTRVEHASDTSSSWPTSESVSDSPTPESEYTTSEPSLSPSPSPSPSRRAGSPSPGDLGMTKTATAPIPVPLLRPHPRRPPSEANTTEGHDPASS